MAAVLLWVIQTWTVGFFIIFVLGFLTKSTAVYSRGWLLLFYFSGLVTLTLGKYAVSRVINYAISWGYIAIQRVILVGLPEYVEKFLKGLRQKKYQIDILNVAYLSPDRNIEDSLRDIMNSARILAPDSVYLAIPLEKNQLIEKCLDKLAALPLSLHLVNDGILSRFRRIEVTKIGDFVSLRVLRPPLSILSLMIKRGLDFVGAFILLLLLAPVMLVTAIAIKLDSAGPIFFTQRRFGFTQSPFQILKFRTMNVSEDGDKIVQVRKNDVRVTRVGQFIRRTNIDELPQLLNVLFGQMSLVGPRPHALAHDFEFERRVADYAYRQKVKPGITGWAQVNGWRGATDTETKLRGRIKHDIFYIENWSLLLDIRILFLTVFSKRSYQNAG